MEPESPRHLAQQSAQDILKEAGEARALFALLEPHNVSKDMVNDLATYADFLEECFSQLQKLSMQADVEKKDVTSITDQIEQKAGWWTVRRRSAESMKSILYPTKKKKSKKREGSEAGTSV